MALPRNGTDGSRGPGPRRVWLFSIPRSGSNLLTKIFSQQSRLVYSGYHFWDYMLANMQHLNKDLPVDQLAPEDRDGLLAAAQRGIDLNREAVEAIEADGKIPLIKDHINSVLDPFLTYQAVPAGPDHTPWKARLRGSGGALNPTLIPDTYLASFMPIFLVRHPARAYPSMFRAVRAAMPQTTMANKSMRVSTTLRWQRMLFEWFDAAGAECIVLDADDVAADDPAVLLELAARIGGDPAELVFKWDAVDAETLKEKQPLERFFTGTLMASSGVGKWTGSHGVTAEGEMAAWVEEFGAEGAEMMKRSVDAAMGDYEFFNARKLTAGGKA